jgi:hypothetical protein
MLRILRSAYRELDCRDVYRILDHAYVLWGGWPDLAYFVPRILECYVSRSGSYDWEDLLTEKLLEASRSDADFWRENPPRRDVGSPMSPAERESLFQFFQAHLADVVGMGVESNEDAAPSPNDYRWSSLRGDELLSRVGFLSAFAEPIEPFMVRWREADRPGCRASYALLLATLVLQQWSQCRVFSHRKSKNLGALPENERFLLEQLQPLRVADYLAATSAASQLLDPMERQQVELAFDWVVASSS